MNSIEKTFLATVRSAIGTESMKSPLSLSGSEWRKLFKMSVEQMLSALVYTELKRIGNNMPESVDALWKGHASYCRAKFDAQLLAINHLAQILDDEGICMMILKGLGLSLLYPDPQNRECNDIDIYCYGDYDKVLELLKEKGLISGIDEENEKHCNFMFDGVNVENHRHFCENVNSANALTDETIESLSTADALTDPRLPGLIFPSPQMGVNHLMMHTLSHLAWSGITMRHVLDCGLYLKDYSEEIDWTAVLNLWKKAGIENGAGTIVGLCRDALHLTIPEADIPFLKKDSDFVLDSTLKPFGRSAEVHDPLRKFLRKSRQFRIRKRLHKLVYNEPFPDSFLMSFAFLKSKSKKESEQ